MIVILYRFRLLLFPPQSKLYSKLKFKYLDNASLNGLDFFSSFFIVCGKQLWKANEVDMRVGFIGRNYNNNKTVHWRISIATDRAYYVWCNLVNSSRDLKCSENFYVGFKIFIDLLAGQCILTYNRIYLFAFRLYSYNPNMWFHWHIFQ